MRRFHSIHRSQAFEKGKHEDPKWMASFAGTCFSGLTLRWHSQLDNSVKQDWALLEPALLERFPAVSISEKTE